MSECPYRVGFGNFRRNALPVRPFVLNDAQPADRQFVDFQRAKASSLDGDATDREATDREHADGYRAERCHP
jgi:hypothetical protein